MSQVHSADGNGRVRDSVSRATAALIAEAEGLAYVFDLNNVMTVREVARWMHVNPATVYRLAAVGGIPFFKAGNNFRFRRDELDVWSKTRKNFRSTRRPRVRA